MKRFCQWPYLVIAILVFLLVNDQASDSQQIKIIKSPNQKQLTLTSVMAKEGHKVRMSIGNMVLETSEFRAIHSDGSDTRVTASKGKVKISHQQTSMEAAQITLSLDHGILANERKGLFESGK